MRKLLITLAVLALVLTGARQVIPQSKDEIYLVERYQCGHGEVVLTKGSAIIITDDRLTLKLQELGTENILALDMTIHQEIIVSDTQTHYLLFIDKDTKSMISLNKKGAALWLQPDGHKVLLILAKPGEEDKPRFKYLDEKRL
jgi:hypothetical protein